MAVETRWVWIPHPEGRVLAFTYVDPSAGPSAKGSIVGRPPTPEQLRRAVDHPDMTFRRPKKFGALPIPGEQALRLGLPKDPPWIGHFERKPVPPPRGEPSRSVAVRVLRDGSPVPDARVRIGLVVGPARELIKLDERTTDRDGVCEFPLAPQRPIAAIAVEGDASSRLVDVPDADTVVLELLSPGALEGELRRAGVPVRGQVSITGRDGGVHKVSRSGADGRYRIHDIVPGSYDLQVLGIDPRNSMTAGAPTFDRITIAANETLRRDYALVAGTRVDVRASVTDKEHSGSVYLLAGAHAPRTAPELRQRFDRLDRTERRSANSLSNDGEFLYTRFADVVPGTYTVCMTPWDSRRQGIAEQPVVNRIIEVGTEPLTVELTAPVLVMP